MSPREGLDSHGVEESAFAWLSHFKANRMKENFASGDVRLSAKLRASFAPGIRSYSIFDRSVSLRSLQENPIATNHNWRGAKVFQMEWCFSHVFA